MFTHRSARRYWSSVLAAACLLAACTRARGDQESPLRFPLRSFAHATKWVMEQRRVTKVVVGEFAGQPKYPSAGGLGLRRILEEELLVLGVKPARTGADLAVQGKYRLGDADGRKYKHAAPASVSPLRPDRCAADTLAGASCL